MSRFYISLVPCLFSLFTATKISAVDITGSPSVLYPTENFSYSDQRKVFIVLVLLNAADQECGDWTIEFEVTGESDEEAPRFRGNSS